MITIHFVLSRHPRSPAFLQSRTPDELAMVRLSHVTSRTTAEPSSWTINSPESFLFITQFVPLSISRSEVPGVSPLTVRVEATVNSPAISTLPEALTFSFDVPVWLRRISPPATVWFVRLTVFAAEVKSANVADRLVSRKRKHFLLLN